MVLEYTALILADQYSKFLNVRDYSSLPDISHEQRIRRRRCSEGSLLPDVSEDESSDTKDRQKIHINSDGEISDSRLFRRKTLVVSRGDYLPSLTVVGGKELKRREIQQMTRKTISIQISFAFLLEILNVLIFGGFFAWVEGWNFFEGIYFAVTSLLTIGYGDYILCGTLSRSVFIWYVFFGIASSTFLLAMLAESAFDQWSVTVQNIEKRVGRYEKKAELKRKYKPNNKSRECSEDRLSSNRQHNSRSEGYIKVENPQSPGIRFPALPFGGKRLESESESDSEPFLAPSYRSHPPRWTDSSDLESTSLIGNPDLV